ncbi:MAG: hypothetical protein IPI11_13485 [Haliscomenobacter sp.]|nr:hypothetical protein [Haliscomenobacter sp.]
MPAYQLVNVVTFSGSDQPGPEIFPETHQGHAEVILLQYTGGTTGYQKALCSPTGTW